MKYTILILLSLLVAGSIILYIFLKSTAPTYEGSITYATLTNEVEVKYDTYGIPHIYAQSSEDAYRALGYVHAQDRLFQMEMIRRLSAGRLAEVLGPRLVKTDKFFRILGIRKMAEKNAVTHFSKVDEQWQKHTLSYLEGVNEYVKNGETPLEFRILGIPKNEFEPTDVYSILGYMGLGFSRALKDDPLTDKILARNGIEYFDDWLLDTKVIDSTSNYQDVKEDLSSLIPLDVEEYLEEAALPLWYGSNCWVVSPEKSVSGKVILSNDTHIGISQPSVWYEAHITYPGFDFYGNHLAGVPFGVIGHTQDRGWGLTIFPLDGIDLYRERLNPNNKKQVWENDKWVDMVIEKEVIKVKGEPDVIIDRKVTRHGPVINDVASALDTNEVQPISFWWNFMSKPTNNLEALCQMNYANSMDEVKDAVSKIDFIGLNVLYGDKEGNIAHWAAGRIPKRPAHVNPKFILDGASGKDELLGFYSFDENPQEENPASGFVVSANNDPGMVGENYFHGYYCPPNRYNRIVNHLTSKDKWSQEDMKTIQLDQISDEHKSIAIQLVEILYEKEKDFDETKKSAVKLLKGWDGGYDLEQIAPTIFTKFLFHTMYNSMVDEIGEDDFIEIQGSYVYKGSLPGLLSNKASIWWDNITTTKVQESRADAVEEAFDKTIEELLNQLGPNIEKWKWKRVHTIMHNHPLGAQKPLDKFFNVGPYPVTGGNDVPNKMMYRVNGDGEYKVHSSPALRILLDFANVNGSESINPTGQSGNVMSPHYKDQTIMFNNGIYRPQHMDKEAIDKESRVLILKPE